MKASLATSIVLLVTACASSSSTTHGSSSSSQTTCAYPAGASTFVDATAVGCSPGPSAQSCQVSNGATILPDGGVTGGTETCSSLCGPSQYELTCTSGPATAAGAIPAPDPSLGCTAIAMPTPSNYLFYCCGCASN